MLEIDGSYLEGGGQILRTSLGLSALTGRAFHIAGIRKGRCNPGLQQQHLWCVKAVQQICNAKVKGAELGSCELQFEPGRIQASVLNIDIGTAGSVTLLMQSLLFPACFSPGPVKIRITGGTDVQWSQPYDYFEKVLLPYVRKFADMKSRLIQRGYYPKGGGTIEIETKPKFQYQDFDSLCREIKKDVPKMELTHRGELRQIKGISHASETLKGVALRQAEAARQRLAEFKTDISIESAKSLCPGSGITLWADYESEDWPTILGADSLGKIGKKAEEVGREAGENLLTQITKGAVVDEHLADQIIPFLSFFPNGRFLTSEITDHLRTNAFIIEKFFPIKFSIEGKSVTRLA